MRRLLASLRFAVLSAGQNFWRNLAISLAAVFVIFLILLMVGGTLLMTHMGDQVLHTEQERASNIKVYLQNGVSQASIQRLADRLARDPRVRSAHFESKDDAAKEAEQRGLPGGSALTNDLKTNPYPASINLDLKNLDDLAAIDRTVRTDGIVDVNRQGEQNSATNYDPNTIPKLQRLILFFQVAGGVIALALGCISLVIIMVTIRTAVAVRQREIEIMKLVGATDWFVRLPFILEGILSGVMAAVAAGVLIAVGYHPIVDLARNYAGFFPFSYDASYLGSLVVLLVGGGAVLGAFGSFLGVRRFLTV